MVRTFRNKFPAIALWECDAPHTRKLESLSCLRVGPSSYNAAILYLKTHVSRHIAVSLEFAQEDCAARVFAANDKNGRRILGFGVIDGACSDAVSVHFERQTNGYLATQCPLISIALQVVLCFGHQSEHQSDNQ